jgi:peptide/nickel transport system permease protein
VHIVTLSLFGTDGVARDIFSRVVYGVRSSLAIGLIALFFSFSIGCSLGFTAGYFGGFVDRIITRFVDSILSIPALFLVIALMAFLGSSLTMLILILSLTGWMGIARIVRGEVIHIRNLEFIQAARMLGVRPAVIIRKHLLPNVMPTTITAAILQLGNIILAEASLSFLGLGIQPPTPSWGNMIGESLSYLTSAWWAGLFPGIVLSLLLVSMHLLQHDPLLFTKNSTRLSSTPAEA